VAKNSIYATGAEAPELYYNKKGPKKLNFLQRWFDRKCQEAWERKQSEYHSRPVAIEEPPLNNSDGVNIRVHGAVGGHIVEFRKYDKHKDRSDYKMYVIPTEQNFTESFSKIVNMEMLR
jgi:hypothetical protein